MAETETGPDLRESRRIRTFKTGCIINADHTSTMTCRIRDLTNKGARLEFSHAFTEGHSFTNNDRFLLQIGMGDLVQARVECEVRWRRGKQIGVLFAEEQDIAPKID